MRFAADGPGTGANGGREAGRRGQERGRRRCETAPKQRGKKLRVIIHPPTSKRAANPECLLASLDKDSMRLFSRVRLGSLFFGALFFYSLAFLLTPISS